MQLVRLVQQAPLASKEPLVQLVPLVKLAHLVLKVQQAAQALLVSQEHKAPPVVKE